MNASKLLTGLYLFCTFSLLIESAHTIKTQLLDNPFMLTSNDYSAYLPGSLMLKAGQTQQLFNISVFKTYQDNFTYPYIHHRLIYRALPFVTLLYFPFSFWPYYQSFLLFTVFSLLTLTGVAWIGSKIFPKITSLPFWYLLPFAGSPTSNAIFHGQPSAIQTLSLFLSFWLFKQKRFFYSGLILSLISIKPHTLMILALLLIPIVRFKRFFLGLGVGIFSLIFISWIIVGTQPLLNYPKYVLATESATYGTKIQNLISLPSLLQSRFGLHLALSITLPLLGFFVYLLYKNRGVLSFEQLVSIAVLLTPVFAFHIQNNDLQLLYFPIFFLITKNLSLGIMLFTLNSIFDFPNIQYLQLATIFFTAIWLIQTPKPGNTQFFSKP